MFRSAKQSKNFGQKPFGRLAGVVRDGIVKRTDIFTVMVGGCFAVAALCVPSEALLAANSKNTGAKAESARAIGAKTAEAAQEGRIHHCIDWHGAVSFQDAPCGIGQRTASVRRYRIPSIDPALQKRSREIEREMDRRNRASAYMVSRSGGRGRMQKPRSACETAKLKRLDAFERAGLNRTFELSSRMDRAVWLACQGR
jgi:hypothetical protein